MNIRITLMITALTMLIPMGAWGQKAKKGPDKGYKVSLHIDGTKSDTLFLGNYYAKGTYAIDTAVNDGKGNFVFQKDRVIYPGLYFVTNQKGNYFEFVIYKEKVNFTFTTKEDDWKAHLKSKGSKENEVFLNFHADRRALMSGVEEASEKVKQGTMTKEDFEAYRAEQLQKNDSLMLKYIDKYPDCMFSKMMSATKPVPVPMTNEAGDTLSQMDRYEYYVSHYFDNVPLDDDFIVRTPEMVWYKRVDDFFNVTLKNTMPDFIIPHVDDILERSRKAPEVFKYLLQTTAERYLQSNVMVYDEVYVHLIQKYFAAGDAVWLEPSVIDENVKRADTWEKILVGRNAPELILYDTLKYAHSLSMECKKHKYTLLLFWSPTCGHCKTTVPEMNEVLKKYSADYDIGTFAILSEPDDHTRVLWKEFIKKHELNWLHLDGGECNVDWKEVYDVITTPKVFLLDSDRKIIAKKFSAETLEGFITNTLEKRNK